MAHLSDGSYHSLLGAVRVRVIEAVVTVTCADGTTYTGTYRLATTLLGHRGYPAAAYLISRTRGHAEFPLIFVENCHYGFRRNLLGLRPWGMRIAAASAVAAALGLVLAVVNVIDLSAILLIGVVAVSLVAFVLWQHVVTSAWVKRAAEAYAERLLEATETLAPTA
jgi:hypothetical protein